MALKGMLETKTRGDMEYSTFNWDKADITQAAKALGYKGPESGAAGYLSGLRDASGNLRNIAPGDAATYGSDMGRRVTDYLSSQGLMIDPNTYRGSNLNFQLKDFDPQAQALQAQLQGQVPDGFTLEPWMVAAAPLAVGGLQAAGVLGTGEVAGAGALEAGAGGEFSLASGGSTGLGGSSGLGYGGAGGVQTAGGFGVGATGGAAGSGVATGLGASGAGGLASILQPGGSTFGIPNNILGGVLQGGLGYLGADKQADAFRDVSNQNLALGAPFRGLLGQSYGKDFNLMNQPGYGDAFSRMADISTRAWSAKSGNPANNPGIQGSILNDVWNQSYLPALANYRVQLGQFGGLGLNTAGAAQLGGASTADDGIAALAGGVGRVFGSATQPNLEDILKTLGGRPNYSLTAGGVKY